MASNIIQNLAKILSSRYGKDVRQAIHDSIHDCYEDGKVGAIDLIAREQIANLVSENNPTEGNSELQDIRVGYDGTTYTSAGEAVRKQADLLSEDIGSMNVLIENFYPVYPLWRKIRIDGSDGSEKESSLHRSTPAYEFNDGETVFGSELTDLYWFVYQFDNFGNFEKILINTARSFSFIAETGKKYKFQLWNGNEYFENINSAKIRVTNSKNEKIKDITERYHNQFDYIIVNWISGKADPGNGAFQENDQFIRSDYMSFTHNEEITLQKNGNWYWFVNSYEKDTHKFKGCIINTQPEGSFVVDGNLEYVFSLWSGITDFSDIKRNYKITITRNKLLDYVYEKTKSLEESLSDENVKWSAKLILPDFIVIGKGESIELFKYGMYYTNAPYMMNLYNVRLLNIGEYIENYTEKIIINCPEDFQGEEIRSEIDLPFFQLLDFNGKVIDSKRVHIYVVDKNASYANKTASYIGDSLTAFAVRSKYTSEFMSTKGVSLVGKIKGDGDFNYFTAHGGCTWWNYLVSPEILPSARKENYFWDESSGNISFQKFYNEVNNGNPVDVMVILLGWNDFENSAFNIPNLGIGFDKISQNVRKFLDAAKEQSPNTKIILESYHFGYPKFVKGSYSDSMPQIIQNKHVMDLNELYLQVSKEYENVYFLCNSIRVDTLHGMSMESIPANKYSSEQISYCLDTVHPGDIGYHQYSDAEIDMILYLLSKN